MNYIDKDFKDLTNNLNQLSLEEIFDVIKNNYLKQSESIKNSLEDYFKKFNYWGSLDTKMVILMRYMKRQNH